MTKEILLYTPVYQYSAEAFVNAMEENKDSDVVVRLNTDGGNPEDMWSMLAKFAEHKGKKLVKVDGRAYSAGTFFLAYSSDSEALDVSQMMIHRAAYPTYIENDPDFMDDGMWENLNTINKKLRTALEAKIDVKKFEEMKAVKMDDIFSNEQRLDVFLTAKEAKSIGLINRIVTITPQKKAEIKTFMKMAAHSPVVVTPPKKTDEEKEVQTSKNQTMTIEKFKADHPEIYAAVIAEGVAKEKDRVGAWMAFIEIDPKTVAKGIRKGKDITATIMAELNVKSFTKGKVAEITADAVKPVVTAEAKDQTEKEAKNAAFEAEVAKGLGLKTEKAA